MNENSFRIMIRMTMTLFLLITGSNGKYVDWIHYSLHTVIKCLGKLAKKRHCVLAERGRKVMSVRNININPKQRSYILWKYTEFIISDPGYPMGKERKIAFRPITDRIEFLWENEKQCNRRHFSFGNMKLPFGKSHHLA